MIFNKILKSKRGVAIENAILFIIVIFMLCALLSSITLIAHYQFKIDNTVLENDVDLDQIGEDFIASLSSGQEFTQTYDNYQYEVKDNTILEVTPAGGGAVLLHVEASVIYAEENGSPITNEDGEPVIEQVNILTWRYSDPETPSDPET